MSYTINLTNGNTFATIPDGTINTTSSMTLVGKNYAGYGQFLDDNFIHLLENGANSTAPSAPLTGQLWFNTTTGGLQVYNGTGFKPIGGANASSTAPTNNTTGDLWYDTVNAQLNVWTGTAWLLVGPVYTAATGVTGAIPATVVDNTSVTHVVVELYVGDSLVGFISKDAAFTPQTAISGFTTIRPGITLSTLVGSQVPLFQGTATNSQLLNSLTSSQFMRADAATGTTGNSLTVGAANNFSVTTTSNIVAITNSATNGNVTINASIGSNITPFITLDATTGQTLIPNLVLSGNSTSTLSVYNITNAGSAGQGNIGNISTPFNTIFATATSAQYADVAERFHADTIYEAGTVVELGGLNEITVSTEELSESVFGVISTRAAYLMNSGAGDDNTHPPIAMTGRVPVRSTGIIRKGDRLVSAGNGLARAAQAGEATAFNVIGRALADKLDSGLGTVEAIVTIK